MRTAKDAKRHGEEIVRLIEKAFADLSPEERRNRIWYVRAVLKAMLALLGTYDLSRIYYQFRNRKPCSCDPRAVRDFGHKQECPLYTK